MFRTVLATYLFTAAACTALAVISHLSPAASAALILLVWLLPAAVTALYIFSARPQGAGTRRSAGRGTFLESVIAGGCGSATSGGNDVELLNDGGEMFPSLIRALHHARRSIDLEYYIFNDDRIGRAIAEVLLRKVRAGVRVRLLYDAVGSWRLSRRFKERLRAAGVDIRPFGAVRFPWLTRSLNIRNHRKIAVIDGSTAFIGGINIARRYLDGDELGRWRDQHLRITGPAAAELHRIFASDWCHAGGQPFDPAAEREHLPASKGSRVQIGRSQTGPTRRALADAFTAAVMQARRRVFISTPYFVPTAELLRTLCIAAAGGVDVRIMVPARADMRAAALAGESYFGELLRSGVSIYLYDSGFLHSKTLVADTFAACVGTANLDCRSLFTNWEVAAFVYDARFAERLAATFFGDMLNCRRLDRWEYENRPLSQRAAERFWRLFAPLL